MRLGGMAKGSGMIHPNMATMLGVRSNHHDLCDYLYAFLLTLVFKVKTL